MALLTARGLAPLGASRPPKMHPGTRNVEAGVPSSPPLALVRFLARVALWPPNAWKVFFLALCAPLYVSNIFLRDFLQKSIAPQPSAAAHPPSAASCGGSSLPACPGYRKSVFEWPRSGKNIWTPAQHSLAQVCRQPSPALHSPAQVSSPQHAPGEAGVDPGDGQPIT